VSDYELKNPALSGIAYSNKDFNLTFPWFYHVPQSTKFEASRSEGSDVLSDTHTYIQINTIHTHIQINTKHTYK